MALIGFLIPVARSIGLIHWVVIAVICAVFGTLGDLLESKIKRMAGLKDSGSFMPGHGGFLDRFDSLLISVPFVWAYLRIFLA
jgi:phosphatidate cytidylyltransferase